MMRLLVIMFFSLLMTIPCRSQESHRWLIEGDELYKKGEFEKAEEAYRKAAEAEQACGRSRKEKPCIPGTRGNES